MIRFWAVLLIALAFAVGAIRPLASATPVNLVAIDPTFGDDGFATIDIAGTGPGGPNTEFEDEPYSLAVQPDGKIVVSGKATNPGTGNMDFAVLRFEPSGALDSTFGWGGVVLVDFVGARDEALSVALQADGKIVLAGLAARANGNDDFGLARLNANGSRDTTFGWNGIVMTDFFGLKDQALGLVVLDNGKIVAGGYATRGATGADFALARYNANGSRDATFGIAGLSTTDYWGRTDAIYKLALQPDGKLVGAGVATRPDGTTDFAVARFNTNGALDSTFGWAGRVATDFLARSDVAFTVMLMPDGKVLAGGLAFNPATNSEDLALAKYNANGSIDTSFATSGKPGLVVTDYFGLYDQALWLLQQPDGKILALGHARHPERSFEFAIARFNVNGTLDSAFGEGGHVTTDFFGGPDGMHVAALFDDGTVLAVGDAYNPVSDSDDFALTRYLVADPSWIAGVVGSLDSGDFATGGQQALLTALVDAQASVESGDAALVLTQMQDIRTHVDGCPAAADGDDWIVSCAAQLQVRTLVDQVIAKLQP